eukprot:Em0015g270a
MLESSVRRKIIFLLSVAYSICLLNRLSSPYICVTPKEDAPLTKDANIWKPKPLASRPVVFVGGCPRSGTTLTRAMLDAHPDIRCGQETHVIPSVLDSYERIVQMGRQGLENSDVSDGTLFRATKAFVSKIIEGHGAPSKYLCNKDPLLLQHMQTIARMFPKAKFLLMVRDGRAVTHSIVSRNIVITNVDITSHINVAAFWCVATKMMITDCTQMAEQCMIVFYEKLVGDPSTQMKEVLRFLDIPWHDNVLRHHEMIGSEVFLSK